MVVLDTRFLKRRMLASPDLSFAIKDARGGRQRSLRMMRMMISGITFAPVLPTRSTVS